MKVVNLSKSPVGFFAGALGRVGVCSLIREKDAALCDKSQEPVFGNASIGNTWIAEEVEKRPMIDSVSIHNFRCFRQLDVSNLKRINLLVGPNSSGKSAFLESLFLSSSSSAANTVFQLKAIRRMGNQIISPTDALGYRGIWEDLFYEFNDGKKIWIKIGGNPNSDTRSLSIEYTIPVGEELPFGKPAAPTRATLSAGATPQIEFKWKRTGYPEVIAKPTITTTGVQVGIKLESTEIMFFPAIWFTPAGSDPPEEVAKRFAEIVKRGRISKIKDAIKKEFSFIKDLSILYQAGIPMVFADIEGGERANAMPIGLLSDGINRLLGICIGIGYFSGGMVLIDQLEDGVHHKILRSFWGSLYSLAKEFNVQLFVSTHSRECIEAMLPTIKGSEGDFCLLRAARSQNAGCTIDSLSGDYLESALEQEIEVR
jgi:AAA15 family ATPase/GTPase